MRKYLILNFIFTFPFLFSSCYTIQYGHTATIFVEFLQPAATTLDPHVRNLAFINGWAPSDTFARLYLGNHQIESPGPVPDSMVSYLSRGFTKKMRTSPRFELKYQFLNDFLPDREYFTWNWVDSTCSYYKLDGLILLQNIDIKINIESTPSVYSFDNREPSIMEVRRIPSNYKLSAESFWLIFDPAKHDIKGCTITINNAVFLQPYHEFRKNIWKIHSISNMTERAVTACGDSFASIISPMWTPDLRLYFDRGNFNLFKAGFLLRKGKLDKAASLWRKNIQSKRQSIVQFSRFNLALYNEMKGLTDNALYEISKICISSPMPEAQIYKSILESRVTTEKLLKVQLHVLQQNQKLPLETSQGLNR